MKKDIGVIVLGEKNVGKTEIINNLLIKKSENDFHGKIEDNFHEKFGNNY